MSYKIMKMTQVIMFLTFGCAVTPAENRAEGATDIDSLVGHTPVVGPTGVYEKFFLKSKFSPPTTEVPNPPVTFFGLACTNNGNCVSTNEDEKSSCAMLDVCINASTSETVNVVHTSGQANVDAIIESCEMNCSLCGSMACDCVGYGDHCVSLGYEAPE
jgi:hypothetical protein